LFLFYFCIAIFVWAGKRNSTEQKKMMRQYLAFLVKYGPQKNPQRFIFLLAHTRALKERQYAKFPGAREYLRAGAPTVFSQVLKYVYTVLSLLGIKRIKYLGSRWQFVLNKGHFHILPVFVVATNFKDQATDMGRDGLLGNRFNHLGHFHFHSLLLST